MYSSQNSSLSKIEQKNPIGDTKQTSLNDGQLARGRRKATEASRKPESNISSVYSSIAIVSTHSDADISNQIQKIEDTYNRSIQSKDINSKRDFTNNKNNQDRDTKQIILDDGKPEQIPSTAIEISRRSDSSRSSKNLPSAFSNSSSIDEETAESDTLGDIFNRTFRKSPNQQKRPYSYTTTSVWPESKISVVIPNPKLRQKYNELIRLKLIELEVLGKIGTVVNRSNQITRSESQFSENIRMEQDHIQEKISSTDRVGCTKSETNLVTNTEHSDDPSGKYSERYSIVTSDGTDTTEVSELNLGEQNENNANKEKMSLSTVETN